DGNEPVALQPFLVDRKNRIVHSIEDLEVDGALYSRITAFGLDEMRVLGSTLLPQAQVPTIAAFHTNNDRILYRLAGQTRIPGWMKFNVAAGAYETGLLSDPQMSEEAFAGASNNLAWDPTRNRGFRIQRVVPDSVGATAYDSHEWRLITYREGEDGT